MKGERVHFVRFGTHAINMDRVVDVWNQQQNGRSTGRVLVYGGDHVIILEGDEADAILRFIDEVTTAQDSFPDDPPPRVSGTADPAAP